MVLLGQTAACTHSTALTAESALRDEVLMRIRQVDGGMPVERHVRSNPKGHKGCQR